MGCCYSSDNEASNELSRDSSTLPTAWYFPLEILIRCPGVFSPMPVGIAAILVILAKCLWMYHWNHEAKRIWREMQNPLTSSKYW